MNGDLKIYMLNIVIASIYSLSFYITYKELPQLKKYRFFSLLMLLCATTYIVELLDYIGSTPLTMFILPMMYYTISIITLRAFFIPFINSFYCRSLIYGNSLILLYIAMNNLFFVNTLRKASRLINSITLLIMFLSITYILIYSLRKILRSSKTTKLLLLRSFLLVPYLIMTGIGWASQTLKLFNYTLLEDYSLIFFMNIFVVVSMGICFTMEGASKVILKLQYDSDTDTLTGVANRRSFVNSIESLIKSHKTFTFVIIDIDHFKSINDTYGHDIGDEVLVKFSDFMIKNIRGEDSFARIGGEEFSLIIQSVDNSASLTVLNRLRELISELKMASAIDTFSITVSMGVAFSIPGETYTQLSKRADRALYKAKKEGRNRCILAK